MKKILLSFVICLLSFGSAFAAPRFKGVDNKHRKTTIRIEISASDRDYSNGLSVDNVRLSNNGETLAAKKVDAIWGDDSEIIFEFKKLTTFADCMLSFTVNGKPVTMDITMDIYECLMRH